MPLAEFSPVKAFLEKIDRAWSDKTVNDFFNSSVYLKKIKSYADAQEIEFLIYTEMPEFFLSEKEKARERKIPTICCSVLIPASAGKIRKVVLVPLSFIILRKRRPGFLKHTILICLHEIAHIEENVSALTEGNVSILECPFGETSCLLEELKIGEKTWQLLKYLGIKIAERDFFDHLLKGITAPGFRENCLQALKDDRCSLREEFKKIKKSWLFQHLKPLVN